METPDQEVPWHLDMAMPALLRAAWRTYGTVMRTALDEAGCGDLPRNGPFVIGAIAGTGAPLATIITHLGVSKQAAGQLVDTMVLRGYLDRAPTPTTGAASPSPSPNGPRCGRRRPGRGRRARRTALVTAVGEDHIVVARGVLRALVGPAPDPRR